MGPGLPNIPLCKQPQQRGHTHTKYCGNLTRNYFSLVLCYRQIFPSFCSKTNTIKTNIRLLRLRLLKGNLNTHPEKWEPKLDLKLSTTDHNLLCSTPDTSNNLSTAKTKKYLFLLCRNDLLTIKFTYSRKARTRIALSKDWCKTWSLSLPILESKVYIFGHSTKSADTHSWLSSLKITLLQRSQSRNASSVFHRLLMPPGENASSQSLPEH